MANSSLQHFRTISDFHQSRGLPGPEHPLISVIDVSEIAQLPCEYPMCLVHDFYSISLKRHFHGKLRYGQQEYDFDEGLMTFIAPGQVFRIEGSADALAQQKGWLLLLHPDFLWHTPLARTIKQYEYFDYAVNEALFLSEKEEAIINGIIAHIAQEYKSNIDKFTQSVIIAQLELLLTYAERFYHRQFLTRKITNHKILDRLETLLSNYFNNNEALKHGLPTVQYVASALHVSPNYLSGLLKVLTGRSTQQHIQDKLIEKAKEKLSATSLSVSEVAYELGFEHPQSFSKLFKSRTSLSPLAFRQSFG
jgi:AraC-like DNA-binding protein